MGTNKNHTKVSCQVESLPISDFQDCPANPRHCKFFFTGTIQEVRRNRGRFEISIVSGKEKNVVVGIGKAKGTWAGQSVEVHGNENGRITIKNIQK